MPLADPSRIPFRSKDMLPHIVTALLKLVVNPPDRAASANLYHFAPSGTFGQVA